MKEHKESNKQTQTGNESGNPKKCMKISGALAFNNVSDFADLDDHHLDYGCDQCQKKVKNK